MRMRVRFTSAIAALVLPGCTLIADFGAFGDDELDAATPLEDGGVSEADAGPRDGGSMDAATPADDGGAEGDAGSPAPDGGTTEDGGEDGGAPEDGGATEDGGTDGGASDPDAGGPPVLMWEMHERIGHGDLDNEVHNSGPQVAVSANGDAIVSFTDDGEVFARRYDAASGTFDAIVQVSDASSGGGNAWVAMDDEGNGIVAWSGTGGTSGIFARRYSAATGWGLVETVQPSEGTSRTYSLGALDMTGDGHIAVAWRLRHWGASPEVNRGHLRLFVAGTGWTAPVVVSGGSTTVGSVRAALTRIGGSLRAVAVYSHHVSSANDVRALLYDYDLGTMSGSLGTATTLESGSETASSTQVGMDDAGNAIVVLYVPDSDSVVVRRFRGGTWAAPLTFNPTGTFALSPALSVAGSGDAMVVWRQCSPCAVWSRRYVGGVWQPTQQISAEESSVSQPSVAVRDDGDALAIWSQNIAATPSVMGAELTAGSWSAAHPLEDDLAIIHDTPLDVALGPTLGVAVWVRETEGTTGPHRKITGALYR